MGQREGVFAQGHFDLQGWSRQPSGSSRRFCSLVRFLLLDPGSGRLERLRVKIDPLPLFMKSLRLMTSALETLPPAGLTRSSPEASVFQNPAGIQETMSLLTHPIRPVDTVPMETICRFLHRCWMKHGVSLIQRRGGVWAAF